MAQAVVPGYNYSTDEFDCIQGDKKVTLTKKNCI